MEDKCSSFLLKTSSSYSSFGQFAMSFDLFCFYFMQSHTIDLSLLNILLGSWSFFLFNKKTPNALKISFEGRSYFFRLNHFFIREQ